MKLIAGREAHGEVWLDLSVDEARGLVEMLVHALDEYSDDPHGWHGHFQADEEAPN